MINILSLNNDSINEIKVKNMDDANIYKKCGYKNTNDFIKLYSGNYKNNVLEIWGKNKGLQKYKNTHTIFDILKIDAFGKCVVILKNDNGNFISITNTILKEFFLVNFKKQLNISSSESDKETYEEETEIETKQSTKQNIEKDESDNESDNSELSYDLYNYSDDEK
tara:strand:- start:46 stop:543 length:498 start_codon:yes stop_codon:yes gene_type:complete